MNAAEVRDTHGVVRATQMTIAVLAVVAAVVGAALFQTEGYLWVRTGTWLVRELVPGVVTFAVVGVIVLRNPKAQGVGWVMLASAMAWGLSVLFAGLYIQPYDHRFTMNRPVQEISGILIGLGIYLITFVLPQLFPSGVLRGRLWRWLLVGHAVLYLAARGYIVWLFWPGGLGRPSLIDRYAVVVPLDSISWYSGVVLVLVVLAVRLRRGPRLVRQQLAPFALAWLLSIAAEEFRFQELASSRSSWPLVAVWLWPVAVAVIIGVTATQVGLWDTRLVVRRFTVYAVVVGALSLLFAAVYFLVLSVFSSGAVEERYRWVALLFAAVAVIAADPLRRLLRSVLERRLLGERSAPLRSLARLDALTSSAGTGDELQVHRRIAEIVADAVRAPGASLALHHASEITVVAGVGDEPRDPVVLPLLHRGERLGELRVAPRTPGEPYGRDDRALLDQLASQAAALVYGRRRDSDIATLRSEAVEALVEQRMSLGRDLHDGLAPLLAGAGLTAGALRRGMVAGSPDAEDAARLATRLRTASSEVRRIAHDLQPTPDSPPLSAVIQDYVAAVRGPGAPVFTVALDEDGDERLPATTELGLSRVALEAITNVVRHARATSGSVSVRRLDREIELVVSDDGVGIAQPYVSGMGITSMRSRVQALGGAFELTPRTGGGTSLVARVPVSR